MDSLQINWADHLDIARCCEAIAEYDLGEGIAAMGGSLALLSHELLMAELQAVAEVGNSPTEKVGRLPTFTCNLAGSGMQRTAGCTQSLGFWVQDRGRSMPSKQSVDGSNPSGGVIHSRTSQRQRGPFVLV